MRINVCLPNELYHSSHVFEIAPKATAGDSCKAIAEKLGIKASTFTLRRQGSTSLYDSESTALVGGLCESGRFAERFLLEKAPKAPRLEWKRRQTVEKTVQRGLFAGLTRAADPEALLGGHLEHDLEECDERSGATLLHRACWVGNAKAVEFLVLQATADMHKVDLKGWTPLVSAAAAGHIEIAEFLASCNAPAIRPVGPDRARPTFAHAIVQCRSEQLTAKRKSDLLSSILLASSDPIAVVTARDVSHGKTALDYAVEAGDLALTLILLDVLLPGSSDQSIESTCTSECSTRDIVSCIAFADTETGMSQTITTSEHGSYSSYEVSVCKNEASTCPTKASARWINEASGSCRNEVVERSSNPLAPPRGAVLDKAVAVRRGRCVNERDPAVVRTLQEATRTACFAKQTAVLELLVQRGAGLPVGAQNGLRGMLLANGAGTSERSLLSVFLTCASEKQLRETLHDAIVDDCLSVVCHMAKAMSKKKWQHYLLNGGTTGVRNSFTGSKQSVTPLTLAILHSRRSIVQAFLAMPEVDVNLGETAAIHYAITKRDFSVLTDLLNCDRIDAESVDSEQCTPLLRAVKIGWTAGVSVLLGNRHVARSAAAVNAEGDSVLHHSLRLGKREIASILLRSPQLIADEVAYYNLLTSGTRSGETPLMLACRLGDLALVKVIIAYCVETCVDLAQTNDSGWTALHYAVLQNSSAITRELLESCSFKQGCSALALRMRSDSDDADLNAFVAELREMVASGESDDTDVVHFALRSGRMRLAQIIAYSVSAETRDEVSEKTTPLLPSLQPHSQLPSLRCI
ncbi:Alpha-latrotoxin-Lt1a [Diplonema papillatum]|nr:Alpha-latrotoxin-Lt1a [Diplonema papillatum]